MIINNIEYDRTEFVHIGDCFIEKSSKTPNLYKLIKITNIENRHLFINCYSILPSLSFYQSDCEEYGCESYVKIDSNTFDSLTSFYQSKLRDIDCYIHKYSRVKSKTLIKKGDIFLSPEVLTIIRMIDSEDFYFEVFGLSETGFGAISLSSRGDSDDWNTLPLSWLENEIKCVSHYIVRKAERKHLNFYKEIKGLLDEIIAKAERVFYYTSQEDFPQNE